MKTDKVILKHTEQLKRSLVELFLEKLTKVNATGKWEMLAIAQFLKWLELMQ